MAKMPAKMWTKAGLFGKLGMVGIAAGAVYLVAKAMGVEDQDWIDLKDTIVDWFVGSTFAKNMMAFWEKIDFKGIWNRTLDWGVRLIDTFKNDGAWEGIKMIGRGAVDFYKSMWGGAYQLFGAIVNSPTPFAKIASLAFEGLMKGANYLGKVSDDFDSWIWMKIKGKFIDWLPDKAIKFFGLVDDETHARATAAKEKALSYTTPYGKKIDQRIFKELEAKESRFASNVPKIRMKLGSGLLNPSYENQNKDIDKYFDKHYGIEMKYLFGPDRVDSERRKWIDFKRSIGGSKQQELKIANAEKEYQKVLGSGIRKNYNESLKVNKERFDKNVE